MSKSTLYIVATPIGNLADISKRAIDVLNSVDKILAEDTRHSKKLLQHYGITTPCIPFHEHNEEQTQEKVIQLLKSSQSIALISDAGTPLISDPGYKLVAHAKAHNINVVPIPGACALIAAISASGLSAAKFSFYGFLPVKESAKLNFLLTITKSSLTSIFYESPHRLLATLYIMQEAFGANRKICLAREISKIYETIVTDDIESIIKNLQNGTNQAKGEIVIIVDGVKSQENKEITSEVDHIIKILLDAVPTKQASQIAARLTGIKKNLIYDYALSLKKDNDA